MTISLSESRTIRDYFLWEYNIKAKVFRNKQRNATELK